MKESMRDGRSNGAPAKARIVVSTTQRPSVTVQTTTRTIAGQSAVQAATAAVRSISNHTLPNLPSTVYRDHSQADVRLPRTLRPARGTISQHNTTRQAAHVPHAEGDSLVALPYSLVKPQQKPLVVTTLPSHHQRLPVSQRNLSASEHISKNSRSASQVSSSNYSGEGDALVAVVKHLVATRKPETLHRRSPSAPARVLGSDSTPDLLRSYLDEQKHYQQTVRPLYNEVFEPKSEGVAAFDLVRELVDHREVRQKFPQAREPATEGITATALVRGYLDKQKRRGDPPPHLRQLSEAEIAMGLFSNFREKLKSKKTRRDGRNAAGERTDEYQLTTRIPVSNLNIDFEDRPTPLSGQQQTEQHPTKLSQAEQQFDPPAGPRIDARLSQWFFPSDSDVSRSGIRANENKTPGTRNDSIGLGIDFGPVVGSYCPVQTDLPLQSSRKLLPRPEAAHLDRSISQPAMSFESRKPIAETKILVPTAQPLFTKPTAEELGIPVKRHMGTGMVVRALNEEDNDVALVEASSYHQRKSLPPNPKDQPVSTGPKSAYATVEAKEDNGQLAAGSSKDTSGRWIFEESDDYQPLPPLEGVDPLERNPRFSMLSTMTRVSQFMRDDPLATIKKPEPAAVSKRPVPAAGQQKLTPVAASKKPATRVANAPLVPLQRAHVPRSNLYRFEEEEDEGAAEAPRGESAASAYRAVLPEHPARAKSTKKGARKDGKAEGEGEGDYVPARAGWARRFSGGWI